MRQDAKALGDFAAHGLTHIVGRLYWCSWECTCDIIFASRWAPGGALQRVSLRRIRSRLYWRTVP
ncbi:MAG: hypothetical protein ABIW76_24545 [Fibrobacteria bacterium]